MNERPELEAPGDFAGNPDAFGRLWTPHRMVYIQGENKPADAGAGDECPLCRVPGAGDEQGLIVARGQLVYAVLNLYPYNSGHLMVVPYRHVADFVELSTAEVAEVGDFTQRAIRTLASVMAPQGFNIGVNQGAVAGAGIATHLHQHVVPRWGGDTNFMPVVATTRVLPQLLAEARAVIANGWA